MTLKADKKGIKKNYILCQTCLEYYGLRESVRVGIIGGMGDIVAAMNSASKVIGV